MPSDTASGWGLHPRAIALTQGNILDRLADESAAWTARTLRGKAQAALARLLSPVAVATVTRSRPLRLD